MLYKQQLGELHDKQRPEREKPGSALTKTTRQRIDADAKLTRNQLTPYFQRSLRGRKELLLCRFQHAQPYAAPNEVTDSLLSRPRGMLRVIGRRLVEAGVRRAAGSISLSFIEFGLFRQTRLVVDFSMIVVCRAGTREAVTSMLSALALPRRQRPHWPGKSPTCTPLDNADELDDAIARLWPRRVKLTMPPISGSPPDRERLRAELRRVLGGAVTDLRPQSFTSFIRMSRNGQKIVLL